MFEHHDAQPLTGFLKHRPQPKPNIESLESREVPAVIGGVVYCDDNGNGLFDAGEQTVANSRINLYDSSNQLIASTTTSSTGQYQFTQRGNTQPTPTQVTREATFTEASTNHTRTSSITQFDTNLGTLTGVEIVVEGNLNSMVKLENLEGSAANMKTELTGHYRFMVGSRTFESAPTRTLQANVPAFDGQMDFQGSSSRDFGTVRLDGTFSRLFLTDPSALAEFQGTGTINVSQNATMESCSCGTGNMMAAVMTTAAGRVRVIYHYTPGGNLGPGTYRVVQATQPAGYADAFETTDNLTVIPGSNRTDTITVTVSNFSDQLTQNNFGEMKYSSITGRVYVDSNRNGAWNSGESGLTGVTILLSGTDVFGNAVNRTTTTTTGGIYSFANLLAGTYTIREIQPANYQQGTNSPGSNPTGTLSGTDEISLTLRCGDTGTGYDFGEIGAAPATGTTTTTTTSSGKFYFFFRGMYR